MPNRKLMSAMQRQSAISDSVKHPERLMETLFNDQHWVYLNVTTGSLMSKIADIALNMQSHDGDTWLLDLFTPVPQTHYGCAGNGDVCRHEEEPRRERHGG